MSNAYYICHNVQVQKLYLAIATGACLTMFRTSCTTEDSFGREHRKERAKRRNDEIEYVSFKNVYLQKYRFPNQFLTFLY